MDILIVSEEDIEQMLVRPGVYSVDDELYEEALDIDLPPSRADNYLILRNVTTGRLLALRINNGGVNMSSVDKQQMRRNINGILEMFKGNRRRLVQLAQAYYNNLAVHNRYAEEDVKELMSLFPSDILEEAGVQL